MDNNYLYIKLQIKKFWEAFWSELSALIILFLSKVSFSFCPDLCFTLTFVFWPCCCYGYQADWWRAVWPAGGTGIRSDRGWLHHLHETDLSGRQAHAPAKSGSPRPQGWYHGNLCIFVCQKKWKWLFNVIINNYVNLYFFSVCRINQIYCAFSERIFLE